MLDKTPQSNQFNQTLTKAHNGQQPRWTAPPRQQPRPHQAHPKRKRAKWVRALVGLAMLAAGALGLIQWYRYQPKLRAVGDDEEEAPLLDQFLPNAEFAGEVAVNVHAPAAAIFTALHTVTLADMPLANWLGTLRYLPAQLGRKAAPAVPTPSTEQPFMRLVLTGGNILLANVPDRELIIGAIGRFHNLTDQQMVALPHPHAFVRFNDPTYQKLAMSIRLEPLPAQAGDQVGYRLVLTHRTHALSAAARRKFARYWIGIKPGGNFVSWLLLRAVKRSAEATAVTQHPA